MRAFAAEGRTVLVSSHLMSEMAQTAARLIIIGRGRLLADTTTAQLTESPAHKDVVVRSPQAAGLSRRLAARVARVERRIQRITALFERAKISGLLSLGVYNELIGGASRATVTAQQLEP